ncbi:MAG: carbohydrate ABC transporter permease [Clostridia bacterium]|nr:carbohydrate ABC transporter permease [Clostridia bacterium]MBQ9482080.1 carbohydrate ABC transporter permease [Clostridia bacterium]
MGNRVKREKSDEIVKWVFFALFVLYAISLLYPFLWCFINSFKTKHEFIRNINGFPEKWTLINWEESLEIRANGITIAQMYLNSAFFTVGCTFLGMFSSSATAYIFSKYDFRGRRAVYTAALVIMMIPTTGSMAAMYRLYNNIGLINTYTGILITAMGGFGSGFLLLFGFYENLSWTYAEAAQIDGAGHFRIYFRIMMPMAIPALTAVGILQAIGHWNDYFTIYMYAPEKVTIAYGIQIINSLEGVNLPKVFAAMMLSIIPVLVVFACFQKVIMNNTSIGGIKG